MKKDSSVDCFDIIHILARISEIVKNLSQRLRPDNSVIGEEEAKWLRYGFDHKIV